MKQQLPPLHESIREMRKFERRPGEEIEIGGNGVVYPSRLYYYAKTSRTAKAVKHCDDTAKTYDKLYPTSVSLAAPDFFPGSLSIASSTCIEDSIPSIALPSGYSSPLVVVHPAYPSSAVGIATHFPSLFEIRLQAEDFRPSVSYPLSFHTPVHPTVSKLPWPEIHLPRLLRIAVPSCSRARQGKSIPAEEVHMLAHLANGQADAWFHLRIGAHRHEDDVDREAEKHAIAEEMRLVEHEMAVGLAVHLQELHRDFSEWWAGWHGQEAEVADAEEERLQQAARGEEEKVDGIDHEAHSWIGALGVHTAENYWGWADEHTRVEPVSMSGELTEMPDASFHVLHAEHFHRYDLAAGEAEGLGDFDGFRHEYVAQLELGWQYKRHRSTVVSLSGEEVEAGYTHGISFSAPSDWHRIALGTSAYDPVQPVIVPSMAGHEVPPVE